MKWVFGIFAVVYAAALALLLVGTWGLFGQERDPLSAVFLLPMGMPWNLLADRLGLASIATLLLAPLINLGLLFWLWRRRA